MRKLEEQPTIFVGSSTKGLKVAEVVAARLSEHFKPYLWNQGLFTPGSYPLEVLERQVRTRDFAVLVCTPDDTMLKGERQIAVIRDNIVFELGWFMGTLGRNRAFMIMPDNAEIVIPSDLSAITQLRYSGERFVLGPEDEINALNKPILDLRNAIEQNWIKILADRKRSVQVAIADRRHQALQRLYTVIVELRDLIIIFPGELMDALAEHKRFEQVKAKNADKVDRIALAFHDDAVSANLVPELAELTEATKSALLNFPYPVDPEVASQQAAEVATRYGLGLLRKLVSKDLAVEEIG